MAKKKKKLVKIECQECGRVNYYANRLSDPSKEHERKKFCKWCRKHAVHKEVK